MSGIFGVYSLDGRPVDPSDLELMSVRLAHRGPDGAHLWHEGPLGLGHRMLHTTPESLQERLPLVKENGKLVITADARIDNRNELLSALSARGPLDKSISDSELILLAYEKWGTTCPARLLGDFAFVIWDARRQTLFCARDHMGVKPFYYHLSRQIFVCASELKALLCLKEVPKRLNEAKVADYLASLFESKSDTFYQDMLRLPPGHTLTLSHGQARVETYWSLDPTREIRYKTDREYAEAFRDIFTRAVSARLRSAFPVGSMLSGGLDSSSIACTARQLLAKNGNGPLHTFSAIFDEVPQCDERPYINAVLALGDMQPHYIYADRISPLADWRIVFDEQNEAFYAPNLFMHRALHGSAKAQGVRVLLDGIDGDTTVSHGIAYLPQLALQGRWISLASQIHGLVKNYNKPARQIFRNRVLDPLVSPTLRNFWWILNGKSNRPAWKIANPTIRPDFARRNGLVERAQNSQTIWFAASKNETRHHLIRLNWGLLSFVMEVLDKSTSVFSINSCYPFYDRRLIEFCLALPGEQKVNKGWSRMVMRRAMAGILPKAVQWRVRKSNLGPNFYRGLLLFEKKLLDDVIINNPQLLEPYIDIPALRQAYNRYASQKKEDDAMAVWNAVTLALWLSQTNQFNECSLTAPTV